MQMLIIDVDDDDDDDLTNASNIFFANNRDFFYYLLYLAVSFVLFYIFHIDWQRLLEVNKNPFTKYENETVLYFETRTGAICFIVCLAQITLFNQNK